MDKVKVYLGYAAKYHFWILSVVVIVLGVFGWMSARGSLSEEFTTNKSSVTGKFTQLQGITSTPNHPNSQWTTELAKLTDREQQEVSETWNTVYAEQQKVLSWPEVMPDGFKRFISTAGPNDEIPLGWLQAYQTEVLNSEFPKLAKIVDAAPLGSEARPGSGSSSPPRNARNQPAPQPAANASQYRVQWLDQEDVKDALDLPGPPPSRAQVRIRQEDWWVYQALLNIIRKTNEAAPYTPHIKVIEEITIGADAATEYAAGLAPGRITKLSGGGEDAMAGMRDSGGGGEGGFEGEAPPPDQNRYLTKEGTVQPPGVAQTEQFKRLPVYLKLEMDQREITRLLTECANYPLPLEVRQLRINPDFEVQSRKSNSGESSGAPLPGEAYDVTVELHGIIYLFNPPDPEKLGTGSADALAAG